MLDDGASIVMCKWNMYDASTWKFPTCLTITKNTYKDRKEASSHARLYHDIKLNPRLRANTIDGNALDECDKEHFALNGDFEINNLQRELNQMNFLYDLSL